MYLISVIGLLVTPPSATRGTPTYYTYSVFVLLIPVVGLLAILAQPQVHLPCGAYLAYCAYSGAL